MSRNWSRVVSAPRLGRRRQRGVVLYVALVVLVGMMLIGVSLLRSVSAGQGVAGNLAFRQNATAAGDVAVATAIHWLRPSASGALPPDSVALQTDIPANAYISSWDPFFNPTTFDWDCAVLNPCPVGSVNDDGTGNSVKYVIHRLCSNAGATDNPNNTCAVIMDGMSLGSGGGGSGFSGIGSPPPVAYYRVTARILGPRNTVSYTQVIMQ